MPGDGGDDVPGDGGDDVPGDDLPCEASRLSYVYNSCIGGGGILSMIE